MKGKLNYDDILSYMCSYYGITINEMIELLKKKENRYMLLLLLKKHDCVNMNNLRNRHEIGCGKFTRNSIRSAEEMLLFNGFFREKYFNMEKYIEKNLLNDKKTLDINNNM